MPEVPGDDRVGHDAEAAFRKAFKRIHGIGPGTLRRWFRGGSPAGPRADGSARGG